MTLQVSTQRQNGRAIGPYATNYARYGQWQESPIPSEPIIIPCTSPSDANVAASYPRFLPSRRDSTVFRAVEIKGAKVRRSKGGKSNDEKTFRRRGVRVRANIAPGVFTGDKPNGTMVNGLANCAGHTARLHPC